jgi:predicted AAA+ superfamily ATPase
MKAVRRNMEKWALEAPLFPDHMSFLVGPRQVGKTTMAKQWISSHGFDGRHYLSFDQLKTRKAFSAETDWIDKLRLPQKKSLLVLDEIHKMRHWKRALKGVYDVFKDDFFLIVTGSGRLDAFQRGGDSLAGRFDCYNLFPLTPAELAGKTPAGEVSLSRILSSDPLSTSLVSDWLELGGFPEPFFSGSRAKMLRWWSQYTIRVTEEDMRDLTALQSIDLMRQLVGMLPARVGSPLSINSLREDLDTSFETVKRYVRIMSQLFFTFELPAFHQKIHRAVKKEKKVYFFNHAILEEAGCRFENAIAIALQKWVSALNEQAMGPFSLHYLRDQDRREVDFLIAEKGRPILLIEAKNSDLQPSPAGLYYHRRLKIPFIQVIRSPGVKRKTEFGAILSAEYLLAQTG